MEKSRRTVPTKGQLYLDQRMLFFHQHSQSLYGELEQQERALIQKQQAHARSISNLLCGMTTIQVRTRVFCMWKYFATLRRCAKHSTRQKQQMDRLSVYHLNAKDHFVRLLMGSSSHMALRIFFHTWLRWNLGRKSIMMEILSDDAARLTIKLQEKDCQLSDMDKDSAKQTECISQLEGKIEVLSHSFVELQNEGNLQKVRELESVNKTLRENVSRLEGALQKSQNQLQQYVRHNQQLREGCDVLQGKADHMERMSLAIASLEREVGDRDRRNDAISDENDVLRADIIALKELVAELRAQLEIRAAFPPLLSGLEVPASSALQLSRTDEYSNMLRRAQDAREQAVTLFQQK